jgi:hypothetical protein
LDEKVNILYKMEAYFKITNNEWKNCIV